ncbi:ras-specific guanine nucleotide-releasing factor 2 [Colossoma macropomum]|uniref:ras-specific guanine nucleotide-releasing factor 2 n=1 Tax=Colossoma macropomum TaxID=42526 RepID=UPI001863FAC1|nr:ras-specific guanine nucleotide-releasing factor 2 [Colossoma macropomum]XP_036450193.1 ras-specific guanine nucleotide-releasing factor 2 [Colossoma macropomum]XP_036450194.1 ras-specific guanine nucleotide-releasing factor 2 [Colossoma macropomum]XP_036450195.1 ras-specific guanine nucleotide-releasing factor 2 [Colossoma macropomum]
MQKSVRYNEGHALYLSVIARKEGVKRGYLSKKTAENSRWNEKYFALYQNVLFYFENEQSARPTGIYLLEGCTCERVPAPKVSAVGRDSSDKQQHYFLVIFGHDGQKPLELRAEEDADCSEWVEAIQQASYSDLIIEREVLMQKYIHLVQILETEKVAANQLRTQLEDQDTEIERLKAEIIVLNKAKEKMLPYQSNQEEEDPDIKKIKKVQSFMRGWLCRRKWKIIVQDYICSPHAESMRKRNQIVFNMVEAETEYVLQLSVLVNCFLRPLRMAASSKKPPISHDDVSSIFLNSETIMFLHEIFHQGLKARIANWPTLVLADLFDILLPMLNIYQEFVRNHQYSLQVLANCKQNRDFDKLLKQYESNAACEGRMLETFLTYPMFQIPRYIITLHELLAHTPHEHVERKSLEFAKSKLEELSKMMHDEVSDTENIRKNLAIERMIVEGCDILLDTSQTFVRQGSLIQLPSAEKGKLSKVRLGSLSLRKEGERQCFLFTKHLLICTRTSGGKLHLLKQGGTLSLIECTLIEELDANDEDYNAAGQGFSHLEFKVVVEPADGPSFAVVLLAPSRQEKAAWTSDISQCIDNIRCNGLMTSVFEENSKVTVPHMLKSDIRLHKDDVDICFSKTLNSCKVPQIRYASVERLLERLTDLRFLSIDFLNTFLHTYRIFTTAAVVMDKLADIYKKPFTSIPVRIQYHSSDRLSISSICPDYSLKITRLALDQSKSLELFFATNQGPWGSEHLNNKSPRLSRKFSSPPPLSIPSRTSSPVHSRKLSLSSPVGGGKTVALDLSAASSSSAASSPTSTYNPVISSPPPTCTKAPLDLSRGPSSPELAPTTPEEGGELPRIDAFCGKLRRSIRRAVLESVSLDKFIPETPTSVEAGDMSPCRSPSTPRHLRYRQAGGQSTENSRCTMSPASAFAIATAAAGHSGPQGFTNLEKSYDKEFLIRRAATNRVLNVLRHWVSKHSQDFDMNGELKTGVITLLEEVLRDPDLLPQERKATANILSALSQEEQDDSQLRIEDILQMAEYPKTECFESLSAMELAEQITLLDHIVFRSIPYEEFLGQGWMKVDKNEKTPYIMKTSQHFNDMSNLVASQIMTHTDVSSRASSIEKWLAVADICRCLNNYNGVLEITSALNRSAIYRLKKTWAKVCKQTKALMDRLQKIVSSEGRFKNLRETLKNCNPPCVPYLGMYLTDLAFIEEGTPNFTEEGLVNFSKMRMISHIIREIRQFQQAPYRIEHQPKVTQFLLDKTFVMDEDTLYELSLKIEPRLPPAN